LSRRLYFLAVLLSACGTTPGARPVSQIPVCTPLDSTAAWARANRAWSQEAGQSWSNDSLRRVLLELRDQDQSARADFGSRIGDSVYARHLTTIDSVLATKMAEILDRFGLPTRSMVGAAGSDAAMLIVQHNWSLQERVLALVEALPPGQISPQALAMLEDRVRVHQGKPQRPRHNERQLRRYHEAPRFEWRLQRRLRPIAGPDRSLPNVARSSSNQLTVTSNELVPLASPLVPVPGAGPDLPPLHGERAYKDLMRKHGRGSELGAATSAS